MVFRRALTAARAAALAAAATGAAAAGAPAAADAPAAAVATAEDALAQARRALVAGDTAAAAAAYRRVTPDVPQWAARLEDAVRWQLLARHPAEAWRILELARRTRVALPGLDYYRALAALKCGVCVLTQPAEPKPWRLLLAAHMYRYPARFHQGTYRADPYDEAAFGMLAHHLDPLQTHALADIPSVTLLAGTGCRWLASRFDDRKTAGDYELAALRAWFALAEPAPEGGANAGPGRASAELRLVELATARKDPDLPRTILARYADFDAGQWLGVPDPERRFVWQRLVQLGVYPPPPYHPGQPKAALVRALVLGLRTPDAGPWMGLLAYAELPAADRSALGDHLLTIDGVPHRPYLLARQAELAYQKGDAAAALAVVRRLLLLEDAEGDEDVEGFAGELAARIFAEYHYDETMLGAVQSSLPQASWAKIFRRLLVQQALLGDARGFARTQRAVSGAAAARTLRLESGEAALLQELAARRPNGVARVLAGWSAAPQTSAHVVTFLAQMGEVVLALTPAERQAASPYLAQISQFLRGRLANGQGQRRLLELMRLFGDGAGDAFMKGSETAREGTVAAGVVDLSRSELLPYPFTWEAPTHLPLRDLLEQPVDAAGRTWEIR